MSQIENQKNWIASPKGQAYLKSFEHKASIRKYNRVRDSVHREETQKKVRLIKLERGCQKCGFNQHAAALEFHHRNPDEKLFRLSESRNYSWKMVLQEIEKCDVLCSNCHAILEFEKRHSAGVMVAHSPD